MLADVMRLVGNHKAWKAGHGGGTVDSESRHCSRVGSGEAGSLQMTLCMNDDAAKGLLHRIHSQNQYKFCNLSCGVIFTSGKIAS
jgi:hypothetical protein